MAIIAAVDESDRASEVLAQAETLGRAFEESVHVVHVLRRSDVTSRGQESVERNEDIDPVVLRTEAAEIAEQATANTGTRDGTKYVGRIGNPAEEIGEYAEEQNARYVVVAPKKRSPTGKALFGSTAQSIILNADCPVVTVKGDH